MRQRHDPAGVAMSGFYWLIWGAVGVFGASAVAALAWAVQDGQMRDLDAAAASIFDNAEPEGLVTDSFPGPAETADPWSHRSTHHRVST